MNSPSEQEPTRVATATRARLAAVEPAKAHMDACRVLLNVPGDEVLYSAIEDLLAERDALKDERDDLKQSLQVLTNSEQMWMEQCSDAQARLVSMEAVVEAKDNYIRRIRQCACRGDRIAAKCARCTILELTPDQSLLESMRKEIDGLKADLAEAKVKSDFDDEAYARKERQLAEAQSNYQTLLDAVNHEIKLRKAVEDQLAKVETELTATRARLAELEGIAERLYKTAKELSKVSSLLTREKAHLKAYEAYKEGKK